VGEEAGETCNVTLPPVSGVEVEEGECVFVERRGGRSGGGGNLQRLRLKLLYGAT